MQYFIVRSDGAEHPSVRFAPDDEHTRGIAPGDRLLFYTLRGDGEAERGTFTGWGEVERLGHEGEEAVAQVRSLTQLKRRVPFSELRAEPRRDRTATIQPVLPEVFNVVLSRARK